jgi:CHAD domain-containing protein
MRVVSRRLRVALRILEISVPCPSLKKWRRQIRVIGYASGGVRELDAQKEFLVRLRSNLEAKQYFSGFESIDSLLKRQKRKRLKKLLRILADRVLYVKIEKLQKRLNKLVDKCDDFDEFDSSIRILINGLLDEVLYYERFVTSPRNVTQLHLLRIAIKKLRYALELFSSNKHAFDTHIRAAENVQDVLGDLHEVDVWLAFLPEFAVSGKNNKEKEKTAEYIMKKCSVSRKRVYKRFIYLWSKLNTKKTWRALRKSL